MLLTVLVAYLRGLGDLNLLKMADLKAVSPELSIIMLLADIGYWQRPHNSKVGSTACLSATSKYHLKHVLLATDIGTCHDTRVQVDA